MKRPWFLDWQEVKRTFTSAAFWEGFLSVVSLGGVRTPPFAYETPYEPLPQEVQITDDGYTGWVKSPHGSCLGRFSRFGINVHRDHDPDADNGAECLYCIHERPGLAGWRQFQEAMWFYHGVFVSDEHMPKFIKDSQ